MKRGLIFSGIIGVLIGLFTFILDEFIKYAEVNSFDDCCMEVFYSRLILLSLGGMLLGIITGYLLWKFSLLVNRKLN
jgi:H+/Cl- antiporter ClcA